MDDDERLKILRDAYLHQYDEDENADLVIDNDDPVLQAAARLMNRFGAWGEITVAPDPDLLLAIHLARGFPSEDVADPGVESYLGQSVS